MAKALTAKAVEQAKADPAKRRELPDGILAGLYLVVQPSGAKSWAVRYRHAGAPRKLTLGSYPILDLAQARSSARVALQAVAEGRDPHRERKDAQRLPLDRDQFEKVAETFLERYVRPNTRASHARETERLLRREVLPKWSGRRVQEIAKRDVIELLDGVIDRGGGLTANRVLAAIRRLFNWAVERDILTVSPCAGVKAPLAERTRDRILSDDELRWLWKAAHASGFPFGSIVKLLLLTGQRRAEVGEMTDRELRLQDRLWVIPRERAKNNEEHAVPLSDAALAIIETLPRIRNKDGFLFTLNGTRPVSGFSRAKAALDKAMLAVAQGEAASVVTIAPWVLHDLRRTVASGMARLGVGLPVIEKILNHRSGSFAGIVGVYQRHDFADEKRTALDVWARHVSAVVDGSAAGNVVALRANA